MLSYEGVLSSLLSSPVERSASAKKAHATWFLRVDLDLTLFCFSLSYPHLGTHAASSCLSRTDGEKEGRMLGDPNDVLRHASRPSTCHGRCPRGFLFLSISLPYGRDAVESDQPWRMKRVRQRAKSLPRQEKKEHQTLSGRRTGVPG